MRLGAGIGIGLLSVACISGYAQPQLKPGEGVVTGSVKDVSKAAIQNAQVRIVGSGRTYSMQTLSNGDYVIKVPPGTYEIYVSMPGFCEGRRAAFSLRADAKVQFDFDLILCAYIDPAYSSSNGGPAFSLPARTDIYQSETLGTIGAANLRPYVLFGKRQQHDDVTDYSGLIVMDRELPVVYTYNLLTVKSASLTYSRKDSSVHATGHVVLQDGSNTRYGSSLDLTFDMGEPRVQLVE